MERYYRMKGHLGAVSTRVLIFACFNPRMAPNLLLRLAEYFHERRLGSIAKIFAMFNVLVFGIEVSPQVQIGGGLFLPHTVGTVLGAASIGDNCTIMQGVTLGTSEPDMGFTVSMRPVIGHDVLIGAGAKVIGRVTVGDNARVGANAVVLQDVPANSLAVGVPAKVMARQSARSHHNV